MTTEAVANKSTPTTSQPKSERNTSRLKRECRSALRALARKHGSKVTRRGFHHCIIGKEGYISDAPHGEGFHAGFRPGRGRKADWSQFFERGVYLSWVHYNPLTSGDNFWPGDEQEVADVFNKLGISYMSSAKEGVKATEEAIAA